MEEWQKCLAPEIFLKKIEFFFFTPSLDSFVEGKRGMPAGMRDLEGVSYVEIQEGVQVQLIVGDLLQQRHIRRHSPGEEEIREKEKWCGDHPQEGHHGGQRREGE